MIDIERRAELEDAFDVLVKHNLWRRGNIDTETANISGKEIGSAIDTAAGAILEYMRLNDERERLIRSCNRFKNDYEQQEAITLSTKKMLDDCRAENRRLKALLATHHIKYKDKL